MIGASYCCHVTLMILLLVPSLTFASIHTSSISSSSSLSPSSESLSHSSSLEPSPSATLSPVATTSLRISSETLGRSSSTSTTTEYEHQSNALIVSKDQTGHDTLTEAPPFPKDSHSKVLSISEDQSEHDVLPHELKTDNTTSVAAMTTFYSTRTSDPVLQSPQSNQRTLPKHAKFKLTATSKQQSVLQNLEKLFLKNIGFERRPRISAEYAVPEYMLDLYRSQIEESAGSGTYLKLKGNGVIAANTVRSFVHTDAESSSCQPPLCSRAVFDISTIPDHETLAGAELRIFVDTATETGSSGSSPTSPEPSQGAVEQAQSLTSRDGPPLRVEVHEIMRPNSGDGDTISRLLDTRIVSRGNSTWLSFDIRPAVLRWKRGDSHNHGLEVRLTGKKPTLSTDNHIRLRRAVHLPDREWALQRPLLVTYTNDGSSPLSATSSSSRSKRLTRLKRRRRQTSEDDSKNNKRNRRKNKKKKRRRKKKGNKNICQRHALYVDFNDVGWDDWIVAPTGYSAYYCHGDCMAPLPHFTKASNHAMLQARVYKVDPSAVPMVCCVPTKMSPISMLYKNEKGRTVLKNYQDMAVEECSCK